MADVTTGLGWYLFAIAIFLFLAGATLTSIVWWIFF